MCKRPLLILASILIVTTIMTGCNKGRVTKEVNYGTLSKSNKELYNKDDIVVSLNKKEYPKSVQKVSLKIENKTQSTFLLGAEDFNLEIYKNNQWLKLPFKNTSIADVGARLKPDGMFHQEINFKSLMYPLTKGKYRVIKRMDKTTTVNNENRNTIYVSIEFKIK
jgi:hypothetical protein